MKIVQNIFLSVILLTSTLVGSGYFALAQQDPYTIAVVGDWDCNSESEKTVANIQQVNPDIVLSTGDMSYTGSADCWLEETAPIKDKILISEGNHDSNYEDYMEPMGVTGKWYSKEVPAANAIFVSVNTEESLDEGSEQLQFIEKAFTDSQMAWKIAFMHKPSITYGHHPSSEGAPETLLPLYDKTKTSIEFSGHNHFMQEIYPTTAGTDGDPVKAAPGEGTAHIVSGGGGRDLYDFETNEVVAQSEKDHGIVVVDLLDNKNAKARFISNDGNVIQLADIVNRNVGTVEPPVEICGDGIDNNNNGQIDENCPPPPQEICGDGIDNNNNGQIDENCPVEPPEEICGDGIDNNNNGQVDENCPVEPPIGNSSQILINDNIQNTTAYGDFTRPDYVQYYNVKNMFDNITDIDSSWGQNGKSGFKVFLNEVIDRPICKVEINLLEPLNQDYHIHMLNTESESVLDFTNKLGAANETININGCVKDVKQLNMDFDTPAEKWLHILELKLFTNTSVITPPPPKEVCDDGIDNDKDGLIDAEDPDCKITPPPVEICGDGIDNDNDGQVDENCPTNPPVTNGTLNIINGTATINALNTNFTIIFEDKSNYTDTDIDENDTGEYENPLVLSSEGVS